MKVGSLDQIQGQVPGSNCIRNWSEGLHLNLKNQLGLIALGEKYQNYDKIELAKALYVSALPNLDAYRKLGVMEFLNGNLTDAEKILTHSYQSGDMRSLPWLAEIEFINASTIQGTSLNPKFETDPTAAIQTSTRSEQDSKWEKTKSGFLAPRRGFQPVEGVHSLSNLEVKNYKKALDEAIAQQIPDALFGLYQIESIQQRFENQVQTLVRLLEIDYPDAHAELAMMLFYLESFKTYRIFLVDYGLIPATATYNSEELSEIRDIHFRRALELGSNAIKQHAVQVFFFSGQFREAISLLEEGAKSDASMLMDYLLFRFLIMKNISNLDWVRAELNSYGILEFFEGFLNPPNISGEEWENHDPFVSYGWTYLPHLGHQASVTIQFMDTLLDSGMLPVNIQGRLYSAHPNEPFDLSSLWHNMVVH